MTPQRTFAIDRFGSGFPIAAVSYVHLPNPTERRVQTGESGKSRPLPVHSRSETAAPKRPLEAWSGRSVRARPAYDDGGGQQATAGLLACVTTSNRLSCDSAKELPSHTAGLCPPAHLVCLVCRRQLALQLLRSHHRWQIRVSIPPPR